MDPQLQTMLVDLGWIKDIPYVISQNRRLYLVHPNSKLPGGNSIVRCGESTKVYDFLGATRVDQVLPLLKKGYHTPTVYLNGEKQSDEGGEGANWIRLWFLGLLKLPSSTIVDRTIFGGLNLGVRPPFFQDTSIEDVRNHFKKLHPSFHSKMVTPKKFDRRKEIASRGGVEDYYDYLPDDFPILKYSEKVARGLKNVHMGQDKLFFSELEFLVRLGAHQKKILVIYPGGGPGTHVPLLASLTRAKFILIDPAFKNKKLNPIPPSDNIVIFPELFDVDRWLNLVSDGHPINFDEIVLISDIRSEPKGVKKGTKEYAKKFDDEIRANMEMQQAWFLRLEESLPKNIHFSALFKFRLTWEEGETKYLKGPRFFQVFAKESSTEVRLLAQSPSKSRWYQHRTAEEQLFFFNSKYRPGSFLDIHPVFGVNYDLLKASRIIDVYFDELNIGLNTVGITGPLSRYTKPSKESDSAVASFFLELDDYFSKHRKPYYGPLMNSW